MTDKLFKEYTVDSEGMKVDVKIVYREGEFVKAYILDIPEYGTGTKALLETLKRQIVMDSDIRADKLLDPKFIDALKAQGC